MFVGGQIVRVDSRRSWTPSEQSWKSWRWEAENSPYVCLIVAHGYVLDMSPQRVLFFGHAGYVWHTVDGSEILLTTWNGAKTCRK